MFRFTARRLAPTVLTGALLLTAGAPVSAKSSDVIARGSCSGTSDWKLKAGPENGRLEIEFEVDTNRVGRLWAVAISDNGTTILRTSRRTVAPSGSFSVRVLAANRAGRDRIVATATSPVSGERCRASVTF